MTDLILQAPDLRAENVENIAAVAMANGVQRLGNTGARLLNIENTDHDAIAQQCQHYQIDYAFLDHIQKLSDCKILALDMDSTLISIECIDEIADIVGRKTEVAAITEAAMRGEISDFSESLRKRVALLKGAPASALERVYTERLQLNTGAEKLVAACQKAGLKTLLVSGGFTFFTDRLKARLNLDYCYSNTLEINDNNELIGKVLGDIVDGQAKANYLNALAKQLNANKDEIIAIGDGANDLAMLSLAKYSVAFRAKPVVAAQAQFALNVSGLDAVLNWFRSA